MWISRIRFTQLENRVNGLDPENVSKRLKETLEELNQFKTILLEKTNKEIAKVIEDFQQAKKTTQAELEKIIAKAVGDKIKKLSDDLSNVQKDLKTTDGQLAALTAETKKHISTFQEDARKVIDGVRAILSMLGTKEGAKG